jgi:hypothetical protein
MLFGPTPDGSFDPIDAEPITITDFDGFVGLAYIDGTVQRTNKHTGEVRTLAAINTSVNACHEPHIGANHRYCLRHQAVARKQHWYKGIHPNVEHRGQNAADEQDLSAIFHAASRTAV